MIFVISAAIILAVYLVIAFAVNGVPDSISETYYTLSPIGFQVMMIVVAILTVIGLLEITDGRWYQFLGFFIGAGLLFVGAAPRFKSYERQVHFGGASVTMISALVLSCLYFSPWILSIWLLCPLRVYKSKLLWTELLCLLTLLFSVVAGSL